MGILDSVVAQFGLVAVTATSSLGAVYAVIASRGNREADAEKTERESEQLSDQTWINRLEALDRDFTKLQALSDARFQRLVQIETRITEHISWDFMVLRRLRKLGETVPDPPSLSAIQEQARQAVVDNSNPLED